MKITGSALFEGYKPRPDQLNIKIKGLIEVEIWYEKGAWRARSMVTGGEFKGCERPTALGCAAMVKERFERQSTEWRWRDDVGEITDSPDEATLTHLIGPNHLQAGLGQGMRKSMCGKKVALKKIAAEQTVTCGQCIAAIQKFREENAQ